jgi:hypothetical protein
MNESEIRTTLLVEAHRIINSAAKEVMQKIGRPIPEEARPGYLTEEDIAVLKDIGFTQLNHPVVQKALLASSARSKMLSYPPKEVLSSEEMDALERLRLSPAEHRVVECLVAEACSATLFQFFCLMDSVAHPELVNVDDWSGAHFAPWTENSASLHDDFYEKYREYEKSSV